MNAAMLRSKPLFASLVVLLVLSTGVAVGQNATSPKIETSHKDGVTTVRMEPVRISGEKDFYYSLHVAPSFKYEGQTPRAPEFVTFELQTVVKARRLNSDLYVVFVIDGETIFLSSNRWAVKNPVRGRRWVGERLAMRMPLGTFIRLTQAKDVVIKMGGTVFTITDEQKAAFAELTKRM